MIDDHIIEDILSQWEPIARAKNHEEMAKDVPDPRDLKSLFEIVFLTSIQTEEGNFVKTRIVFCPDATPVSLKEKFPLLKVFPFIEPIELSAKNLRKIALAFDQNTTSLVVSREQKGKYLLIGSVHYGSSISRLESGQGQNARPHALTISTKSPGNVTLGYSDFAFARFYSGKFELSRPGPMASYAFIDHIVGILKTHGLYQQYQNEYWLLYRECLERLYTSASVRGHGSTIIWVPNSQIESAKSWIKSGSGTKLSSQYSAIDMIKSIIEVSSNEFTQTVIADRKRDLSDYIDLLAHMSCIDGALIIDENLCPHLFGAHLNAREQWKGLILEGREKHLTPIKEVDHSIFVGTRHSSARDFVSQFPGVVAFVVSEDGPVRAMFREADSMLCWPDCLSTVFFDN